MTQGGEGCRGLERDSWASDTWAFRPWLCHSPARWPQAGPPASLFHGRGQHSPQGPSLGLSKYCHDCGPKSTRAVVGTPKLLNFSLLHVYDLGHDVNRTEPTNLKIAHDG